MIDGYGFYPPSGKTFAAGRIAAKTLGLSLKKKFAF